LAIVFLLDDLQIRKSGVNDPTLEITLTELAAREPLLCCIFIHRTAKANRGDPAGARKIYLGVKKKEKHSASDQGWLPTGQTAKARSGHRVQSLLMRGQGRQLFLP
jgi:hypothetical protein